MGERRITLEQVRHVAHLARLELTDEQLETYREQLDTILGYMEELDAIDVSGVEPTHHAVPMDAPLREDRVAPSLSREEALEGAPQTADGGFVVPRVLE